MIYFIDPEDKVFKETIKNACKKLETSVALAMPCKIMKNCGSDGSNKIKTKLACILEADEPTRMRMGNSIPHYHQDHIAGKGENSVQHYNLVHKFIPMPQAMKIPAAKAVVDKEWEKLEKISAWNLTKVRSKKEVIDEARTTGAKVHFASLMDICITTNGEVQTHEEATENVKELDIFLTMKSSKTRQQYCRLESFAMKTGIPTSGSMVKNHISFKTGFGYNATRRTSFLLWYQVCQVHLLDRHRLQRHL